MGVERERRDVSKPEERVGPRLVHLQLKSLQNVKEIFTRVSTLCVDLLTCIDSESENLLTCVLTRLSPWTDWEPLNQLPSFFLSFPPFPFNHDTLLFPPSLLSTPPLLLFFSYSPSSLLLRPWST